MAGLESATDRIQTVLLQQLEQGGLRVQVVEGLVAGAAEQDQKLPDWIEVANRQVAGGFEWRLERRTLGGPRVQFRAVWRFPVGTGHDGAREEENLAVRLAKSLVQHLLPLGTPGACRLLREMDESVPFGNLVRMVLAGEMECDLVNTISVDSTGTAWAAGTTYKVCDLILDHYAYGFNLERIWEEHHRQVPLDRIHAAFTWYDNHRSAINAEIEATIQAREEFRSRWGEPPVVERLRKLTLCESGDCTHPP